jgi:hypothetical protein
MLFILLKAINAFLLGARGWLADTHTAELKNFGKFGGPSLLVFSE